MVVLVAVWVGLAVLGPFLSTQSKVGCCAVLCCALLLDKSVVFGVYLWLVGLWSLGLKCTHSKRNNFGVWGIWGWRVENSWECLNCCKDAIDLKNSCTVFECLLWNNIRILKNRRILLYFPHYRVHRNTSGRPRKRQCTICMIVFECCRTVGNFQFNLGLFLFLHVTTKVGSECEHVEK